MRIVARTCRRVRRSPWRPSDWDGTASPNPGDQREPQRHRNPKEWKNGRTPIIRSFGVTQNTCAIASRFAITLRCDSITPLGSPGAAAREDDRRQDRRGPCISGRVAPDQPPRGSSRASRNVRTFSALVRCRHHVFEQHHAVGRVELGLRQELLRRDHGRDAALRDGRGHGLASRREVQVHRHLASDEHGRDSPGAAGIEAGSSSPTIACPSHVRRTHRDSISAADQHAPVRQLASRESAIANAAPMPLGRADARGGAARSRRSSRRIIASLDSSAIAWRASAADVDAGIGAPKLTDTGYGICSGHFQKKRPCLKLNTLPHSRSRHTGMTGHVQPLDDPLEPALERQQVAGPADGAFGEDAHDVAALELGARLSDRRQHLLPVAARHWDRPHHRQQLARDRQVEVRPVDHEADEPLHARADQEAVDVRQVIADQQRRAARRHVLDAMELDAIQRVGQQQEREAQAEIRQQPQHVAAGDQLEHAEDQDDAIRRRSGDARPGTTWTRWRPGSRPCSAGC